MDVAARIIFIALVIAWFFAIQRFALRWSKSEAGEVTTWADKVFVTGWSFLIAIPITGLSVGAAFGALEVVRWIWNG
jgi:hypothetical protein